MTVKVLVFLFLAAMCCAEEVEVNASGQIDSDSLDKSTSASLAQAGEESTAERASVKEAMDIARMAFNDEDGLAVAGFFVPNDDGSVKNREEGSAYQVFRDSTLKNAKLPFGKSTDEKLAAEFGAKNMDSMWVMKKNAMSGSVLEIRKCQFFDDLSIYIS